jgi:hypothetical protein
MTKLLPMLLIAAGSLTPASSEAQPREPTEYEVKAAFLYNFAKYVQWPPPDRPTFVIGVFGRDPFGRVLDDVMRGQKVHGRPVVVQRFTRLEAVTGCDLLFVSSSERDFRRIIAFMAEAPVLTVGEADRFADGGGMINLTTRDERIRFEVNPAAVARAGLKASSQLLRLATIIEEQGAQQ